MHQNNKHLIVLLFVNSDSYTTEEMDLSWFEGLPVTYSDDFVSLVSRIDSTVTTKCSGQSGPHDGEGLVCCFLLSNKIKRIKKKIPHCRTCFKI